MALYANSPKLPQQNCALRLAIYWLIVGIPLVWGIFATLLKTADLFR